MSLGPAEILIVMVVALLVLGPEKLPKAARQLGQAISEIKKVTSGFQEQVDRAMRVDDAPSPSAKDGEERRAANERGEQGPGDVESVERDGRAPADAPHPGTEGFRLIDEKSSGPVPPPAPPAEGTKDEGTRGDDGAAAPAPGPSASPSPGEDVRKPEAES